MGLQISPDIDYCEVACVDVSNEWVKISFSGLKDALFNWEDLHADEVTGFEAESHFFCCADGRCEMYVVEDCAATP